MLRCVLLLSAFLSAQKLSFNFIQCGAITAILAVSASAGGVTAFRKMGVIQKFPERMHKTLKWMHRNVSGALVALGFANPTQLNLLLLQLGLITYYSGLLTIEIALTHAAVYKVSPRLLMTLSLKSSCLSVGKLRCLAWL